MHNGVLFSHKEEQNYVISGKMDGSKDHCIKQNKPDIEIEKQISPVFAHM
jgi:hypothetical protein